MVRKIANYTFENPENNEWLTQYNKLVSIDFGRAGRCLHHIMPRCKYPELEKDKRNFAMLPLDMHWRAHYLLWKYRWEYALEFQFIHNCCKKRYGLKITEDEEQQLKEDIKLVRKFQKAAKEKGIDWVR